MELRDAPRDGNVDGDIDLTMPGVSGLNGRLVNKSLSVHNLNVTRTLNRTNGRNILNYGVMCSLYVY